MGLYKQKHTKMNAIHKQKMDTILVLTAASNIGEYNKKTGKIQYYGNYKLFYQYSNLHSEGYAPHKVWIHPSWKGDPKDGFGIAAMMLR